MFSRLEKRYINARPFTVNRFFLWQFEWTAAYMEAEEHISKRAGCSVPAGTENPWFYSQRGWCDGTLFIQNFNLTDVLKNLSRLVNVVLIVTVA